MLRVRMEPIGSVKPHPNNPRKAHDVEGIARSIRAFGWRQPIVVWDGDGCILAGHGRLLAATHLGLDKVAVHRVGANELTAAQAAAYRLADNRSAETSEWDDALLLAELEALDGRARAEAGFEEAYLDELRRRLELESIVDAAEDDVPEVPKRPVTNPGDLWVLGKHRLLCGDATVAADVARVLGDVTPLLMVTDPPYGVNYEPMWRDGVDLQVGERSTGKVYNDDRADWREAWALFPGHVAYVWHAGLHAAVVAEGLNACGFQVRSQIIWVKQHFVISRGNYHWQHEPCWYAVHKRGNGHWTGDRKQTTIWTIDNNNSFGNTAGKEVTVGHSAQKPVEVMRRSILNNSSPGQAVYDPFVGSGTTIIAAETTGRSCLAIEIDPAYCDVVVMRWQNLTGQVGMLEGGGTHEEVAAARAQAAA